MILCYACYAVAVSRWYLMSNFIKSGPWSEKFEYHWSQWNLLFVILEFVVIQMMYTFCVFKCISADSLNACECFERLNYLIDYLKRHWSVDESQRDVEIYKSMWEYEGESEKESHSLSFSLSRSCSRSLALRLPNLKSLFGENNIVHYIWLWNQYLNLDMEFVVMVLFNNWIGCYYYLTNSRAPCDF